VADRVAGDNCPNGTVRIGLPTVGVVADQFVVSGDLRAQRDTGDHHGHGGVGEHELQPLLGVLRVEQHGGGPEFEHGQLADQARHTALEAHPDPPGRADAEAGEVVGQPVRACVQLAVGDPLIAVHHGDRGRGPLGDQLHRLVEEPGRARPCGVVPAGQDQGAFLVVHQAQLVDRPGRFHLQRDDDVAEVAGVLPRSLVGQQPVVDHEGDLVSGHGDHQVRGLEQVGGRGRAGHHGVARQLLVVGRDAEYGAQPLDRNRCQLGDRRPLTPHRLNHGGNGFVAGDPDPHRPDPVGTDSPAADDQVTLRQVPVQQHRRRHDGPLVAVRARGRQRVEGPAGQGDPSQTARAPPRSPRQRQGPTQRSAEQP